MPNAGITDVSGLAAPSKLWEAQLNPNLITDVSPLANVKTLKALLLEGNPVADYPALQDIYPNLKTKDLDL